MVRIEGTDILVREIKRVAGDIQAETGEAIRKAATEAYNTIAVQYRSPKRAGAKRTGSLAKGLTLKSYTPLDYEIRSRAPHAWLYEYGSEGRHLPGPRVFQIDGEWITGEYTGKMPASHIIGRTASRIRRSLRARLKEIAERRRA